MKSSRAKALALSAALACSMALPPAFAAAEDAMRPGPSSARSAEEDAPSSWADAGDDASSSGETPVQDSLAADGSVGESGGAGAADGSDPADPANAADGSDPADPAASADAAKARAAVPSWGFDGISVAGMSGQQALSRVTTDEDGTSRFWTNSASVKLLAAPSAPLKLLARAAGDPVPKAADFSAASGALTLKAQDLPRDVYALAEADCTFNAGTPDEKSLKQGDIVCLPRVCADATPARLDGNAAAEGGRLFFGTLYASSLALTVPAADPAPSPDPGDPADASDPADAASGPVKAQLLHDGSLIAEADAAPADRGAPSVSFRLKLPVGSYDLQKLSVRLTDVAGNRADARLAGLVQAADGSWSADGLSRIQVVDDEPSVLVSYQPALAPASGFFSARSATVRLDDARYAELTAWYASLSDDQKRLVAPVASFRNDRTGATLSVTLDDLMASNVPGQADVVFAASGTYRLEGAGLAPGFEGIVPGLPAVWDPATDFEPFTVDVDVPAAGQVVLRAQEAPDNRPFFGCLYAPGPVTVEFALSDAVSGVDPASVVLTLNGRDQQLPFTPSAPGDTRAGTAVWEVPPGAAVDLSQVSISFKDLAGNRASIDDVAAYDNKNMNAASVFAGVPEPALSVSFHDGNEGAYYHKSARMAAITVEDPTFGQVVANDPHRVVAQLAHDGGGGASVGASDFSNPSGDGRTWKASVLCSEEGVYRLRASFENPAGLQAAPYDSGDFMVDLTAPEADAADLSPNQAVQWRWLFVDGQARMEVSLSDALAGVDPDSVRLCLEGEEQPISCEAASDGLGATAVWTIPAADEAVNLAEASVSFSDRAGNVAQVEDLAAFPRKNLDVVGVFADATPPAIEAAFDNDDVRNGKYYNAPRTATVTVTEASFGFMRDNDPERAVVVRRWNGEERIVRAEDFQNPSGDGVTWTAQVPCEPDGIYRLDADLTDPSGKSAEPYRWEEFVVDTVAPVPGRVLISPHESVQWEWLFAADGASASFSLSDELSGIDGASVALSVGGQATPTDFRADGTDALAVWELPPDDRAVPLSDVSLRFADKAGNAAAIPSLLDHEDRDLNVKGLYADGAAPVIDVAFDNDDVRNGKYYNAPRTATVTVTEASFGFVRDNDPYRTVVTRHLDDSALSVRAEDFQNPSGDGVTWTAQVPCDSDGVYLIEAELTDPSGKRAEYRGEEFVVDTTAPLILASFDNDQSEGGMYYKAPRTATVTVHDDNFSADLAEVGVTASDASGAAAAAPGIDGWTELPVGTWTSHVAFGQELHYAMSVACTDLAGNAAEVVEVPEFVIDLTAPGVRVERVADRAAYRDAVAPLVTFEDVNFEPYLAEVSIVGAVRGEERYFSSAETLTDTSRTLDFADFDYRLDVEDVYTLTAKVRDKAGNESSQTVTFSVNRFGSNYQLSPDTAAFVGSYAKRGQSVVVTETNVSGLASSSVSLAHNDSVRTLSAEADYAVAQEGGQESWSRYTYTLPAELFSQDGYYRVMLSSRDVAGGLSENLMEGKNADRTAPLELVFAVDGTAPAVSLGNVEAGSSHYAPSQRVDVLAGDNMEAERAVLYVDGQARAEWGAEELAGSRMFDFSLPAADAPQTLRLETVDRAGNTASTEVRGVVVTGDLARYVLSTPAILYPLVAAVILVPAAVGGTVFSARRSLKRRRAWLADGREGGER